jgi:uncharacterized repeat protein (TIGR01451 family)
MRKLSASIAMAVALLCALLGPMAPAEAQVIRNTAYAHWNFQGQRMDAASNDVAFAIATQPVTLDTYVVSPGTATPLVFSPSRCGGVVMAVPGINGNTAIASVEQATRLHIGDAFYFRLTAPTANLHPDAIDTVTTELVTTSGDKETIQVYETGPNTGVFVGAMPTTAIPPQPQGGDCRLSVAANDAISIHCLISGAVKPIAVAQLDVLADPFGFVFDSEDGSAVDGATVSIVDAATGAPATVFAADGVTRWPASMTTGQAVTDSAGTTYQLRPGEYRFPLVANGTYRLVVSPPSGYLAPSAAPPASLAPLKRGDGSVMQIVDASFGRAFAISSPDTVRIDVPVDRPPIAVSLTKSVSRASAQPGDLLSYAITVRNVDMSRGKRGVVVEDRPSPALRLRADSVRVDGVARPDIVVPAADGHGLTIRLGELAAGATRRITYAMTVRPNAPPGQALNHASATDSRGLTGHASAVVRIEEDAIAARMTLVGRISAGGCGATGPHPGVANVRVMLEDGSFAVTDADGRYHFDGLVPGTHVIQASGQTLPEGGRFAMCGGSSRQAGSANSRFVTGQGGSLAVADFHVDGLDLGALAAKRSADKDEADTGKAAAGGDTDWLALGDGPTDFLFPAVDHNPRAPAIRVAIRHRAGQKVELSLDGRPVDKVSADGTKVSAAHTFAVSLWRGLPLDHDETRLTAVVRDADGSEAARLERVVHFNQTPARVELLGDKSKLVADGRTRPLLALRILDRNGRPVHAGVSGEFGLSAPYESAEALDGLQSRALSGLGRAAPHWTVRGDDGVAWVELAPTMVSGALDLDFTFGDRDQRRKQTIQAWVTPGDIKWTLVGLAEGSLGKRTIADAMERKGRFDSDLGDKARVAFYAKGRVMGQALLTLAYDSARQKDQQQLLGAIDPRAYYTVYADGSNRRFDAASRDKLYLRIEARAFTALFGDYETGFTQTQLARYQRTMTGVKAEGRFGRVHLAGFGAKVSAVHRRVEFQGGGVSGPYSLRSKAMLANSETVVLQVRDRLRSEIVLSSTTLSRFIDYDIDLISGTISFKQPLLSRDFDQNPQFVVIDYDTDPALDGGGEVNGGVRADWTDRSGRLRLGASGISDTSMAGAGGAERTELGGIDLRLRAGENTEIRAEAALSRRAGQDSTAWLVEAEHHDPRLDLLAYVRAIDQGYGVGQLNGPEGGRRKIGVDARYRLGDRLSFSAATWQDASRADDGHREAVQVKAEYRGKTTDARLGAAMLHDHLADGRDATSTVIEAGVTRRLLDNRLELDTSTSVGIGGADSIDLPARHLLAARFALNSRVKLVGSYEITHGGAIDARNGRFGVEAQPWRGARATAGLGRQEIREQGARSYAAFGLAQSLDVSQHLALDATVDSNRVIGGFDLSRVLNQAHPVASGGQLNGGGSVAETFTAVTLGAAWRQARWSVTLRGEWRKGELATRRGVTFGTIRQIGEGQVVGAGLSWTRAEGEDGSRSALLDGALAFARRPADSDFAWLGKLEFRADNVIAATTTPAAAAQAGPAGTLAASAFTLAGNAHARRLMMSVSGNWSPGSRARDEDGQAIRAQRSEIGLFAAVRYNFDRADGYTLEGTTLLGGLDVRIGIGPRFELGATATVRAALADGATSFAIGPQIGFVPAKDVLLTLGYNVTGFRDRDFAAARTTTRGVFAGLKAKFDAGSLGFLGLR